MNLTNLTMYETENQNLEFLAAEIYKNQSFHENSALIKFAEKVGDFISLYYIPVLVFTGSVGNILSVLVFFKTKLRKLSSSYYLAALGISDTCFLFGLFATWLTFMDIKIYNRQVFCQFFTYFSGLCSFLSVWYVVAFTVERFIAVLYPLKRQTMCTVRRAKIVLCVLTFLGAIHSAPCMIWSSPQYSERLNATICDVPEEYKPHMAIYNYVDTVLVFIVPFTTIVVLNSFTGFTVWKVAGVRRTMTMQKRKSNIRKTIDMPHCGHTQSHIQQVYGMPVRKKFSNSSQIKVTKMLLMVSSVFVCLNLPSYVMRVRAYIETEASNTTILIQYFCYCLFITNFGINFGLYCLSGQNFRKAVVAMFKNSTQHRQELATQNTVSEYIKSSTTNASRRRITRSCSWTDTHELQHLRAVKK